MRREPLLQDTDLTLHVGDAREVLASRIDRFAMRNRTGSFPRWLGEWARLRGEGWTVEVVLDRAQTHAVGMALLPPGVVLDEIEQQLSLLAEPGAA